MIKLICKLIGHKFAGYEANGIQQMPDKFWCARCKKATSITKGWN